MRRRFSMRKVSEAARDMPWSKDWDITPTDLIAMREDALVKDRKELAKELKEVLKYPIKGVIDKELLYTDLRWKVEMFIIRLEEK
jgi:hypothetical protein